MATDPEDPFNLMPLIEIQENWKAWADRSPPGYKFHPSDETLISKYLIKKQLCEALPPNNIPELTTYYSTHPEAIVVEHPLHITQDSWFFFSLRDENYPQHTKAIRDAANGYWQTTTNVPVHANNVIGQKRTQVFLEGKGKKKDAVKTNWHMHEYSIKIKPTPNAVDWVIVRLSPPQPKMKSLQPQNDQLQHRQPLGDFGADRSWENSAPQGPQPLQPQMVQNVNLLQPYQINQNHQMYKQQNDPLQHRQPLGDFGADRSWENSAPQGPQPLQPQMVQNVILAPQGLQAMEPQMEKNVNLLQPDLITQNQQTYHGPLQHRQLPGDFGVDQSWENPAQGPQPMQPQMLQNVNLMYQPPHDLPQFMQQLGDFGAGWSSAPQGLPPMQLPCDFGAYWSGEQPAVYEGSPFGANWSNLRGGWSREQPSTAADSLLGSNILPNANLDITQQPAVYERSPFGANWSNLRGGWSREQPSTAADSLLGSNILPNANLDITQQNLGTNLNPTAQLGANPGGGEQMTDEEN